MIFLNEKEMLKFYPNTNHIEFMDLEQQLVYTALDFPEDYEVMMLQRVGVVIPLIFILEYNK